MERRDVLKGLVAGLVLGPQVARAEDSCTWEGPSPAMVTGPFPPRDFRAEAAGRKNPGAWRPVAENDFDLAAVQGAGTPTGQIVTLEVRVLAADCRPASGATVELWQADAKGFYNHKNERRVSPEQLDPAFGYWGSGKADKDGIVKVRTVVPGKYPAGGDWWRPPHLHWSIRGEGIGQVTTQSYFEGDTLDQIADIRALNEVDYILHHRESFAGGLGTAELEAARRRSVDELVVRFEPGQDATPTGRLTLRV